MTDRQKDNLKKAILEDVQKYLNRRMSLNEGTWGVGPLQSDGVLDIRDSLLKKTRDEFLKEISNRCTDEPHIAWQAVGLCEFLMDMFIAMKVEFFLKDSLILDYYEKAIRNSYDEEWFDEWKDPEEIKASVEKCKRKLKKYAKIINGKK